MILENNNIVVGIYAYDVEEKVATNSLLPQRYRYTKGDFVIRSGVFYRVIKDLPKIVTQELNDNGRLAFAPSYFEPCLPHLVKDATAVDTTHYIATFATIRDMLFGEGGVLRFLAPYSNGAIKSIPNTEMDNIKHTSVYILDTPNENISILSTYRIADEDRTDGVSTYQRLVEISSSGKIMNSWHRARKDGVWQDKVIDRRYDDIFINSYNDISRSLRRLVHYYNSNARTFESLPINDNKVILAVGNTAQDYLKFNRPDISFPIYVEFRYEKNNRVQFHTFSINSNDIAMSFKAEGRYAENLPSIDNEKIYITPLENFTFALEKGVLRVASGTNATIVRVIKTIVQATKSEDGTEDYTFQFTR